jgi:dihydrofolate synthase/folylpolyglutamate synthase
VVERISMGGAPVDAERFVDGFVDLAPYLDLVDARHENPLSYFEVLTALAFSIFADAPVDVAVVEVGLGGTWDSTNLVEPAVAVITPVGLDHQDYLGDTVEEIAAEKAGIIKADSLVVMAQQELEPARVLLARAAEVGATVAREGLEFGVASREVAVGGQLLAIQGLAGAYDEIFVPLHGLHQAHNASVALAAVEGFLGGGQGLLDLDAVRTGFAAATSPGRLEVIRRSPAVVLDAAHNLDGARALAAALEDSFTFSRVVGLVAVLQGKDAAGLLATLEPLLNELVVTQSSSPRAIPADELGSLAAEIFGADRVEVVPALLDAYDRALELAETETPVGGGAVLVTGSVVTVGEVRALVKGADPVR